LSIFAPLPPRSIYSTRPRIVGVVFSRRDLLRAKELRPAPDFFELRLDALAPFLDTVESAVRSLTVPLIITARHPREGGVNDLTPAGRTALLQRLLDRAAYIDIELRALRELESVRRQARRKKIGLIISFHNLNATPNLATLRAKAQAAKAAQADIFKVATRTDTADQLERLLQFFDRQVVDLPISAMGIGKLGRVARLELARRGSALVYGSVGRSRIEGQMSVEEFRAAFSRLR
jgi:3-dehydroquinate dehydratase-1